MTLVWLLPPIEKKVMQKVVQSCITDGIHNIEQ